VFAARLSPDYLLLTLGRKSAWGVLSLGRTDVGEQEAGYAASRAAGTIQKFSSQSAAFDTCGYILGGK